MIALKLPLYKYVVMFQRLLVLRIEAHAVGDWRPLLANFSFTVLNFCFLEHVGDFGNSMETFKTQCEYHQNLLRTQ
jgi:hypothetical protein